jgi:class 3 adenylate cyclase/tetratricopeptide (TPR) repeat protein
VTAIQQWLQLHGLGECVELFERERIDLEALRHLSEAEIKELNLPLGLRVRLKNALQNLQATSLPPEIPARNGEPEATKTSAHAGRVERRQLTVMFCDLVGSTSLAEQLDPEELRDLMRAYQGACTGAVTRYEGHVAQYLGDGLMVYFGWPRAHEDDAERAVRAALEIVKAVKSVAAPSPLCVRIGIATGSVVVGETGGGDASVPKLAVGETPNLASRVQSLAKPDEIVIAATTQRLVGEAFVMRDMGEHALRGIVAPVRTFHVTGASGVDDRFEASRGKSAVPIVGRESELALLQDRWRQVVEGEGQVVVFSGEPGVGKSRIARTLRAQTGGLAPEFLRYQCSPFFANTAFHPVIEHLKRAAGIAEEEAGEMKLGKLEALLSRSGTAADDAVPLLAALLSLPIEGRYPPLDLSAPQRRERAIEALTEHIRYMAQSAPVVVLFEDVHWIDPSTRELLDYLVARIGDARVMLIVTHRPEFNPSWGAHSHVTLHSLNRLSRRQCALLVESISSKPLPEAVIAQIVEKTDGVPLFVEELTKAVLESDLLVDREGRYELSGALESLRIPATLNDSLMARLDRFLPVKEIAQIGAAIGREFSYELLAAIAPMGEPALGQALESLVRSELIYQRGSPPQAVYVFKHALVQDAAYDSLLKSRRAELHQHIAKALETRPGDSVDIQPEIIAHHYSAAGLAERAVPYWLKAGHNATTRAAYRESAAHLIRGRELLRVLVPGPERDKRELELMLALGEAQMRGGEGPLAMKTFEQAVEMARTLEETEILARAAIGFADASWRPGLPDRAPVRLLHEASRALGAGDSELKVKVLIWLAVALGMTGAEAEAEAASQGAEAMAERMGITPSVATLLFRRLPAGQWTPDKFGARIARAQEALRLARQAGDLHNVLGVLPVLVVALAWIGDLRAARTAVEELAPLAEKERQPFYSYFVISSRAGAAFFEGRFAECEALAQKAFGVGESVLGLDAAGPYGVQMFSLRRQQGRLRELAPLLEHFVKSTPAEGTWRPGLALIYAELGMLDEARAEFDQLASNSFSSIPEDSSWLNCMGMLAEVCHVLGDRRQADALHQFLSSYAKCNIVAPPLVACYGSASRHLGLLATTLRRWDEAERYFVAALELNERQGGRPWVAHTQHAHAAMLCERGNRADWDRAIALNAAASAIAGDLGMQGLVERVAALKERLGA